MEIRPAGPVCRQRPRPKASTFRYFRAYARQPARGPQQGEREEQKRKWKEGLLLLLLLLVTKTAAQHSCHMLQVRDFNGILLGIGSKVWRDVSSWTSCCCGTQVLVGLLLVFCCVVLGGGQKTTTGLQILFLGGVETTTSFGRGGPKNNHGVAVFVSRMW